ncbi:Uncharacterised protein [Enterobacter ludwigii]|jgi:hypothetical protein|nr:MULTISPECIES: hypothetical protein [Enterobacteriaceae]EIY4396939.1 hypothetical protein [Escherichia coli]MDV1264852.1 hypothetical protein [Citrobacter freundii]RWS60519.1 hypothetical protein DN594_09480 [Enterobacter cloacae]EKS6754561.1 hypothetical protein [Enterobacter asburiae]EUL33211.1 hypothetical protein P852_03642 [Enterobacter asburiae]
MKVLRLVLISALAWSTSNFAGTLPKTLIIQCDNGVKATLNTEQMDVSGLLLLPFKRVAEQDDDKIIMVYGNDRADTKVLIQYAGPRVFLQDRNNWVPCDAYRANS